MYDAGSTLRPDLVSWGNGVSYFSLPPTTQESKWLLIFLNTNKNTHTRKHTRSHKTFDILEHKHILTVTRVDTNLCNANYSHRQLSEAAVTQWGLWLQNVEMGILTTFPRLYYTNTNTNTNTGGYSDWDGDILLQISRPRLHPALWLSGISIHTHTTLIYHPISSSSSSSSSPLSSKSSSSSRSDLQNIKCCYLTHG